MDYLAISPEDVEQELALLRLEGKNPKRSLVLRRLSHGESLFDELPVTADSPWSMSPMPEPNTLDQLIDWAHAQSEEIAEAVFAFMEEPTDEGLSSLLVYLAGQGIPLHEVQRPREKSLTKCILEALDQPRTIDELYQLARSLAPSRRPEAAVRQVLRRYADNIENTGSHLQLK